MRDTTSRSRSSAALCALAAALAGTAACGVTPGRAIAFAIHAHGASLERFTTATGWVVTLEEASVALGPVYVYAPDDATDALASLLVPIARAHGGHDPFGQRVLRAELLEQQAVDALDPTPHELGVALGSAGPSSDLVLALDPPNGGGPTMWIAGLAEKDGVAIPFRGGLDLPAEGLGRFALGVPLVSEMDDRGTLMLAVRPERWLDQAQFDRLTVTDGDRFVIGDDQVALAWRLAARHPASYAARWVVAGDAR